MYFGVCYDQTKFMNIIAKQDQVVSLNPFA